VTSPAGRIRDLFASDITRNIPPVVYFHEQSPEKLAAEVSEYIITGGWDRKSPNHRRVPRGIHEEYVRLLENMAAEMGDTDLPAVWVSGFYGSGKSSFAKLLGLALGGAKLPDGTPLAQAWLARDTTDRRAELRKAWDKLRERLHDPLAVVFDLGATARDREQVHAVCVRQLQATLGYCSVEPLVADFELKIERSGEWARFTSTARRVLGRDWAEVAQQPFAEEQFSAVMAAMYPERYRDPMAWFASRGGTQSNTGAGSPEDAVAAIRDMLEFRRRGSELFFVVDEVSQYVLSSPDRIDRMRAFATALGAVLRGAVWLIAIGQQKLDEAAGEEFLVWAQDRFPPRLRVHLDTTNIRDVVHKRLLQKTPAAAEQLRELYQRHRPDLQLHGYRGSEITVDEFVDVYPLLPDHIDLILRITTAMRVRSRRMQGDDQAIRGLLQVLGELFRERNFADRPVGTLVTFDELYDVQHTSLDSDTQSSMARVLSRCANEPNLLLIRAAKVVALLELIQDVLPTEAELVAQCLYGQVGQGNNLPAVTEALEQLREWRLLAYGEKHGYKIQSTAGEEWAREREEYEPGGDEISTLVQDALRFLLGRLDPPKLEGRGFPWAANFSDRRRADDASLVDPRSEAVFRVDFRLRPRDEESTAEQRREEQAGWVRRSSESALSNRLVWVIDSRAELDELAKQRLRSQAMIRKYKPRRESLLPIRQTLLAEEESLAEGYLGRLRAAVGDAWLAGAMYFRGRTLDPREQGREFGPALVSAATRLLPDLYPHFVAIPVLPGELLPLLEPDPSGVSAKFLADGLGIFEAEHKRYVPTCAGVVPRRVEEFLRNEPNPPSGATLIAHFGGPPFGYTVEIVKACVIGLLRAGKLRIQPEGAGEITAVRDADVRDLFDKDRSFRRATIALAGDDEIGFQTRARLCKFFEDNQLHAGPPMEREDHAIADAVATSFPGLAKRLRVVIERLQRLPSVGKSKLPDELLELETVLERAIQSSRQTKPTVRIVKQHFSALKAGLAMLAKFDHELRDELVAELRSAHELVEHQLAQLRALHGRRPIDGVAQIEAHGRRILEALARSRPWTELHELRGPIAAVRERYTAERQALLEWQEQRVDLEREAIKRREGFAKLDGAAAHEVLRPLAAALDDTPVDAIAPPLLSLSDSFTARLDAGARQANKILDKLLSEQHGSPVREFQLNLRDRELQTEAEVEAMLDELRRRLLEHIRAGARVRLT
jgi:hypothetical protein